MQLHVRRARPATPYRFTAQNMTRLMPFTLQGYSTRLQDYYGSESHLRRLASRRAVSPLAAYTSDTYNYPWLLRCRWFAWALPLAAAIKLLPTPLASVALTHLPHLPPYLQVLGLKLTGAGLA
jgi:hypothetical protein